MTPEFFSELDFRDLNRGSGKIKLLLLSDLVYYSAVLDLLITVPAKFVTDLASIPRILWNILPPIGAYDAAAVVHDYLYAMGQVERKQADLVLREAMGVCEVIAWQQRAIYAGVRVGGWKAWGDHRATNKKAA